MDKTDRKGSTEKAKGIVSCFIAGMFYMILVLVASVSIYLFSLWTWDHEITMANMVEYRFVWAFDLGVVNMTALIAWRFLGRPTPPKSEI